MVRVEIVRTPIDDAEARRAVSKPAHGAVLLFHGVVRDHHRGRAVTRIDYHAYEDMARAELGRVASEVAATHDVEDVVVVHRVGVVEVGEASLLVAVGAHHRQPAFEAALELIEELKRRVPIWKKEYGPDGAHWVEGLLPGAPVPKKDEE
jgi:molybdopterin synthase catalytic subunit